MTGVWRVGRKVGRTIYRGEVLVGVMDTPEIAAQVVEALSGVHLCPPHDSIRSTLETFEECVQCLRNERDGLRGKATVSGPGLRDALRTRAAVAFAQATREYEHQCRRTPQDRAVRLHAFDNKLRAFNSYCDADDAALVAPQPSLVAEPQRVEMCNSYDPRAVPLTRYFIDETGNLISWRDDESVLTVAAFNEEVARVDREAIARCLSKHHAVVEEVLRNAKPRT